MIIQNTNIAINFPRVEGIKKKYLANEEFFKEKFNEASILPIPDDAPIEMPRILIKSKGEHSQISISPNIINLQTVYTDKYSADWELCEKYINERMNDIFNFVDKITEGKYYYIGVVTDLFIDDCNKNGNKILYKNLFKKSAPENLEDLIVRYTYSDSNKYYTNIALQSARVYENINNDESGQFTDDKLEKHTISVEIDVNDRYSYNSKKGYMSDRNSYYDIMNLTTKIIKEKLNTLVESGEYL